MVRHRRGRRKKRVKEPVPPVVKRPIEREPGVVFDLLAMHEDRSRFFNNRAIVTKNADGSITLEEDTLRSMCFAPNSTITEDNARETRVREYCNKMAELQQRGYWDTPSDFGNNLIIKGKVAIEKIRDGGSFTIELNSIEHNNDEDCLRKGGAGYHFTLESSDGRFNHEKEQYHAKYKKKTPEGPDQGNIIGKTVEFEHRIYEDSEKNVIMETYVGGKPIKKTVDKNNFGKDMKFLDTSFRSGECIHWASPIIILKANEARLRLYDFKVYAK
jgi:hypothetical protein